MHLKLHKGWFLVSLMIIVSGAWTVVVWTDLGKFNDLQHKMHRLVRCISAVFVPSSKEVFVSSCKELERRKPCHYAQKCCNFTTWPRPHV